MGENLGTRTVGAVDEGGRVVVKREDFRTTWSDGTKLEDVQILKAPDGWKLTIRGTQPDGNCRSIRTSVTFTPDGEIQADEAAASETCTGNPCSNCEFALLGGCKCLDLPVLQHSCNHSTSHRFDDFVDAIFLTE